MTDKILTIALTPKRKKFLQALVCVMAVAMEVALLYFVVAFFKYGYSLPVLQEAWGVAGVTTVCLLLVFVQGFIPFHAHREFRESGVRFEVTEQHIRKVYTNGRIDERNWSDLLGIFCYRPLFMSFRDAPRLLLAYGWTWRAFSYRNLCEAFAIAKLDPRKYGLRGKWLYLLYPSIWPIQALYLLYPSIRPIRVKK